MDAILQWGVDLIVSIQTIRTPVLDAFFITITAGGSHIFFMLMLTLLYWCVDRTLGARAIALFLFSTWTNSVTKNMFNQPRPYHLNPSVRVASTGGPGLPSGHAQGMVVVWGYLAWGIKKRWFTITAIALILLVSFSRLYVGVHFPTDILGGWVLGLALLALFAFTVESLEERIFRMPVKMRLALCLALPPLFSLLYCGPWTIMPMGVLSGFLAGLLVSWETFPHDRAPGVSNGILRFALACAVMMLIHFGAKPLLPKHTVMFLPLYYLKSFATGIWISLGAPWLFRKTGLS